MIRMVLFALGFVAVTIALIVLQPGASRQAADDTAPLPEPVTRADPLFDALTQTEGVIAPAPSTPRVTAAAPSAPAAIDDQAMRQMTWDTLSSLNHATGRETAPGQPGSLLHTIVRRSMDAPAALGPRAQVSNPAMYVVQPGDSLVSIAERIYGDVNMTGPLFAANQALLTRPDDLAVGQTLILPEK